MVLKDFPNFFFFVLNNIKKILKWFLGYYNYIITPRGIRIPVTSVKGRCPRPLDDGGYIYEIIFS
uniref:Uncharacterized protein n=1 Tax=Thorea hispida TaxID=202687 RepID=A0A1Z1XAQ8_9FLOR|nr:hypothetical protein [Thorea hispida]